MAQKQEPRPAYHRRMDLRQLQERALALPVVVSDAGHHYEVRLPSDPERVLQRGRYEVIVAYLNGWTDSAILRP